MFNYVSFARVGAITIHRVEMQVQIHVDGGWTQFIHADSIPEATRAFQDTVLIASRVNKQFEEQHWK